MEEYKRFVAYVYEYRRGKKEENCGYIRVEARNGICDMEVHLKCPGLPQQIPCIIYGFKRQNGQMEGYILHNCMTRQNAIECSFETENGKLNGNEISLNDLGGMILATDSGAFFGTEWDDQPIIPDSFYIHRDEMRRSGETENETNSKAQNESNPEVQNGTDSKAQNESNPEVQKETDSIAQNPVNSVIQNADNGNEIPKEYIGSEMPVNAESAEKNLANDSDLEESLTKEVEAQESSESEVQIQAKEITDKMEDNLSNRKYTEKDTEEDKKTQNTTEKEYDITRQPYMEPPVRQNEEYDALYSHQTAKTDEDSTVVTESQARIRETYMPFPDGEIRNCRKISATDFRFLHPRDRALRNNRFLSYGYQQFGFLLIGQQINGRYILGVPGMYSQQERFMANMFGFSYFKESPDIELPGGRGGFWYRPINSPNFR